MKRKYITVLNVGVTLGLTALWIYLAISVFNISYLRLAESGKNLWEGLKYYISSVTNFSLPSTVSVNNYSEIITWNTFLPKDFSAFKEKFVAFWLAFFDISNFKNWIAYSSDMLFTFANILSIAIPCILALIVALKIIYRRPNTTHNKDTVPLKIYKGITKFTVVPLSKFIRQYIRFVKDNKVIYYVWNVVWALNLKLASILIEAISFYLYFAVSFDFSCIYVSVVKLLIDLQVIFKSVPIFILIPIGIYIFERWRRNVALNRLRRLEARNCGFINELPIVSLTCGSMGKKKTTIITDMALSQEVMFRQKALSLLQKADMKFPFFSWISFEMELRKCMEYGTVYNLATCKEWVRLKRSRYLKHGNDYLQLYGYDSKRYGLTYSDALKVYHLFDVLETYAQLYFIYVIESSLIVSNYSIRTDNRFLDEGNFPLWHSDFFTSDLPTLSRHSHILDFDILRLGKKVIENNKNTGSFEFGVIAISEIGKERGNNLELRDIKKDAENANQKNDLFNSWLKMCRHSATVDNFPFIKVFADEQRPESWGADARELCDIIHIVSSDSPRSAYPFFSVEDDICKAVFDKFLALYYDFRFIRGDNTLLVYLLKSITARIVHRNVRLQNTYGYSVSVVEKERGTLDGKTEKKKYYLMNKKIYSNRFSTDCFADYFNDMAKRTNIGLNDYKAYQSVRASVEELKLQNSYFIRSLYGKDDKDNAA